MHLRLAANAAGGLGTVGVVLAIARRLCVHRHMHSQSCRETLLESQRFRGKQSCVALTIYEGPKGFSVIHPSP